MKTKGFRLNRISGFSNAVLNTIFITYSLCCIIPLILMISVSLTEQKDIVEFGYRFIPDSITLESYKFLLEDPNLVIRAYIITIVVTILGSAFNVLTGSMYSYAISRKSFPFRKFFTLIILITMIFHGGVPTFYYVYTRIFDLKNTILALLLPGLGQGFHIFIMLTYFKQNVPVEIIESAKIDGASEMRTFFRIVLPLSLPILATIGLFSALFYWNDFFNCMLFIDDKALYNLQYTMQRAIMNMEYIRTQLSLLSPSAAQYMTQSFANLPTESVRMAMVVVAIGPIIFAYPFFQRYFIEGLTIGSIKG